MHILFITEKWCDCDPGKGLTNSYHNLFGSLAYTGLATFSVFHPDEYMQREHKEYFTPLMFEIFKVRPDIIIATWYSTDILELFKQVREKIGIPIIALWWDSITQMHMAESFLPYVTFNIVVDSTEAYLKSSSVLANTGNPNKYMSLWTPQDPRLFNNPEYLRNIDVSFIGSLNLHPYRSKCIKALEEAGIKVLQTGGQREQNILISDYAGIYKRSKICLNFSDSTSGLPQLKGRVFEATLCGALLLESDNIETSRKFLSGLEYISFDDEKDLVAKVEYYLANEDELSLIAQAGQKRAEQDYSATRFWNVVFERVKSL